MKEIHGIVEIQRNAWQMNDLGIVPTFEMMAVSSVGTVLVALDKDDKPIGFIYAYDQIPDSHYSHMMAVLREWQGRSVGYELKKKHMELAREKGIKHIRWTVDPLLPSNSYINFSKLGSVSNKYYVNYYGSPEHEDIQLYAGLDTDRLLLDWRITDERVVKRMKDCKVDRITKIELMLRSPSINIIENDLPIDRFDKSEIRDSFSVQVPANFQELKENNLEAAKIWRIYFRELCLHYFKNGWHIIDYHSFNRLENYYEFNILPENSDK